MGFNVALEDEHGTRLGQIDDPENLLHQVLPQREDDSYSLLSGVDWYGDTVFNRLQLPALRTELQRLQRQVVSAKHVELLERIARLAARAEAEVHLYLRFIGD